MGKSWLWAFVALAACGGEPAKAPDSGGSPEALRDRIAAGCKTTAECTAQYDEADAAWQRCNQQGCGRDQQLVIQNRQNAHAAVRRVADAEAEAERQRIVAGREAGVNEQRRVREEKAATYEREQWSLGVRSHFSQALDDKRYGDRFDRKREEATIAKARAVVDGAREKDATLADELATKLTTFEADWKKEIAEEETCRATPQCMADRVVPELCQAITNRKEAAESMARERANPSGVVNVSALHSAGADIQGYDEQIARLKKQYASAAKKPFTEAKCKR